MNVKLLKDHMPGCHAVRLTRTGRWDTPWSLERGSAVYLASDGSLRGSSTCFLRARCNIMACPARALVREGWIDELIHKELGDVR